MAGLITFCDKTDPKASFVFTTRMPSGRVANLLSAIKLVNTIRLGECAVTDADALKAKGLGPAIKAVIAKDGDRYFRLFDNLRAIATEATITEPDLGDGHYPEFEICEGPNEVTLSSADLRGRRGFVVYDVGQLFNKGKPANPSDEAWKEIVNVVLSAWTVAEAGAIHPDHLNKWTSCSKKTLTALRNWTFIRSTGRYPPHDDKHGSPASPADLEWATKPFTDF